MRRTSAHTGWSLRHKCGCLRPPNDNDVPVGCAIIYWTINSFGPFAIEYAWRYIFLGGRISEYQCYVRSRMYCRCSKSGIPRPVTYTCLGSKNGESEYTRLAGRTGSHPSMAPNPMVLHPGFVLSLTSLRPFRPCLYSHGLREPSGGLPCSSS